MLSRIGPGPAQYQLPSSVGYERHDPRKNRKPMYSFGVRPSMKHSSVGPGPGNYLLGKITRFGQRNGPEFTMGNRIKGLAVNSGPGPAAYLCAATGQRAPQFSFGVRLTQADKNMNPGPDRYYPQLNLFKSRAPEFTMAQRLKGLTSNRSPGPAAYGVGDKNRTHRQNPMYTMQARTALLTDRTQRPAPNAYNLMPYAPGDAGPKFSFGVKHFPYAPPLIVPEDNC